MVDLASDGSRHNTRRVFIEMGPEGLEHSPPETRKQANLERAAAEPAYAKAEGDPDWELNFEEMFGKAANQARGLWAYAISEREKNYTGVGDDRNLSGDYLDITATTVDDRDIDGAAQVRRAARGK